MKFLILFLAFASLSCETAPRTQYPSDCWVCRDQWGK